MRGTVFIPWRSSDVARVRWFSPSILRLAKQAQVAFGGSFLIHVHVNGRNCEQVVAKLAAQVPYQVPLLMSASPSLGKVTAIHHGADIALENRSDVLVVVDNDVVLRDGALEAILAAFRTSTTQSASAMKAPFSGSGSSEFQRLYSYAVQESFRHNLFSKRPTGSLYAIDPAIARAVLTPGLWEGHMLTEIGARQSGVIALSPYAEDFRSEVARRARHWRSSKRTGSFRLHSNPGFLLEAVHLRLPPAVDQRRFAESVEVWSRVHRAAARSAEAFSERGRA